MKELPEWEANIVRRGELESFGTEEIRNIADTLGVDVSLMPRAEAIRRLEREVKRADSIKKSYED